MVYSGIVEDVTNPNGFIEDYKVYASVESNLGDHGFRTDTTTKNYIYWGLSEEDGVYTESHVLNMDRSTSSSNGRSASNDETFTWSVTAEAGEYIVFAYPTRLTTSGFYFDGSAQEGGMNSPQTLPITNANGWTEDYYLYRSENSGLGATSIETKDS